jgi:hypothetical protein
MWDIQIERLRRERHTPVIRFCLKFIAIELAILFNSQILNLSVGGRSRDLHNQKTQRTLHTGKQKEQMRWNWYTAASKEEDKRVEKKSGDLWAQNQSCNQHIFFLKFQPSATMFGHHHSISEHRWTPLSHETQMQWQLLQSKPSTSNWGKELEKSFKVSYRIDEKFWQLSFVWAFPLLERKQKKKLSAHTALVKFLSVG